MIPSTRQEAIAVGAQTYFTGKPCKHGHVSLRNTRSCECRSCQKEYDKKYGPEWYQKNKPKCDAASKKWAKENREKRRIYDKRWSEKHPDYKKEHRLKYKARHRVLHKKWRDKNKEKVILAGRKWKKENPERVKLKAAQWRKNNLEKTRSFVRNRRARRDAAIGTHSAEEFAEIRRAQRNKCAYCRVPLNKGNISCDHIVPISKGGRNDRSNIQVVCRSCNSSKHDRDPIVHAQAIGMLL